MSSPLLKSSPRKRGSAWAWALAFARATLRVDSRISAGGGPAFGGRGNDGIKTLWPLLIVLVLAALVRLAYLVQHARSPYFEPLILDPEYYHGWALRIREGDWGGAFFGLPLYPAFLAAVYAVSNASILAAKSAQALLGVAHAALVFALAQTLFRRHAVSLIAALFAAIYGPYIFHEPMLVPEALAMPLYTAALLAALRLWDKPSFLTAALTGVLIAAAGCAKAGIFLFLFLFAAAMRNRTAAVLLLAAAASIAPVTLHNWRASGDFIPLTWHGGMNFYIGNNPGAEGIFRTPPGIRSNVLGQVEDSRLIAEAAAGRPLKLSEVSGYWYAKGRQFIFERPAEAAVLWLKKAAIFVNRKEVSDVEEIVFSRRFSPILAFFPGFLALFTLAVPGLAFGFRELKPGHRWVIGLWLAGYSLAVLLFFVNARYRLPVVSALMPFAAFAAHRVYLDAASRNTRGILAFLALAVTGFAASRAEIVAPNPALQMTNVGNILVRQNKPAEALPYYLEAIKLDPRYLKVHNDIGVAYRQMGKKREAMEAFKTAAELDSANPYAFNNLGLALSEEGEWNRAELYFRKALALRPGMPEAHNNLGMVYAKKGDLAGAEKCFLQALSYNPKSAKALTNLGLVHYYRGDRNEARRLWKKALEADPSHVDARRALAGMQK